MRANYLYVTIEYESGFYSFTRTDEFASISVMSLYQQILTTENNGTKNKYIIHNSKRIWHEGIPLHIGCGKAHEKPQCRVESNWALTSWNLGRCRIVESRQVWTERKTTITQLWWCSESFQPHYSVDLTSPML